MEQVDARLRRTKSRYTLGEIFGQALLGTLWQEFDVGQAVDLKALQLLIFP